MHLDLRQKLVAEHEDGHMLVLAGAGSGKTSSIIQRAANRIESGMPAQKILLMTFTNKASREMQERLRSKLQRKTDIPDDKIVMPTITTFHSFGHRFINKNPEICQRQSNFSIMQESDVKSLLKEFMSIVVDKDLVKSGYEAYSLLRNDGLDSRNENHEEKIFKLLSDKHFEPSDAKGLFLAYQEYELQKEFQNTIDFHDLINLPIHALRENADIRYKINEFIQDITIDEAQDNNLAQYKLLKLIGPSAGFQSIVMIGDDDQSIHRWRGANPDSLHTFQDDYSPSVYLLENNYRSQPEIVHSATAVIRHNTERMEKSPVPILEEKENTEVKLFSTKQGSDMVENLVKKISEEIKSGIQPNEIAVLYRTNKMADFIEPYLLQAGIPYAIKKGTEILERSESKLMIAAARLAVNPRDQSAFKKIAEIIPGLGEKRIKTMFESLEEGQSIFELIDSLPKKAKEGTEAAFSLIQEIYKEGPSSLIKWTYQPEYIKWMEKKATASIKAADNDNEVSIESKVKQYERNIDAIQSTINERLRLLKINLNYEPNDNEIWAEAFEVILRPPEEEYESQKVMLSTAHSAKGLEWTNVHIVGFSEGLMPMSKVGPDSPEPTDEQMKEERCLAYVAMTRAKDNLYLHHASRLMLNNGSGNAFYQISRFFKEAGYTMKDVVYPNNKPSYSPPKNSQSFKFK